jgi:predicted DCC family thiol-disulfide oxidoreductase YuxK
MENKNLPLLLFDDRCTLCLRFKQALERIPESGEIRMVSIYHQPIYEEFPHLNREECQKHVHFINEKGEIFKGEEAIAQLVIKFPIIKKFSWLITSGMGQKALRYFHKIAKSYREKLIKECKNCKS